MGIWLLTTSSGAQIPLSQVAHIRQQTGESCIAHEMNHRVLLVRIDNRDRALSDYLEEAQRKIGKRLISTTANIASNGAGNSRTSSEPRPG